MRFVFWQNILSPHQSYFLRNLAEENEVILGVVELVDKQRVNQGWEVPNVGKAQVIELKSNIIALNLLRETHGAFHFFSGIASYPLIKSVFKKAVNREIIGIIAEAPIQMGYKTYLRILLYRCYALLYDQDIKFIFAMGILGVTWYKKIGFTESKIYNFQYTIEIPDHIEDKIKLASTKKSNKTNFVFIGQFIERKGIIPLIRAFAEIKYFNWNLHLIGDGPLNKQVIKLINKFDINDKIILCGTMKNKEATEYLLNNCDYLILPSVYDGWGAVINEALCRGVRVITNEKCGASCLVENSMWGEIYTEGSIEELTEALKRAIYLTEKSTFDRAKLAKSYINKYTEKTVENFLRTIHNYQNTKKVL